MTGARFTIALAFLYVTAAAQPQPPVTVVSPCECRDNHGEVAWDGVVETFDLEGHPKAKRCYAWSFVEKWRAEIHNGSGNSPVDSPESAVKVAIAAKGGHRNNSTKGQVVMREKKKPKKVIRIQDLKPKKDAKGGGKPISVTDIHRLLDIGISKSC